MDSFNEHQKKSLSCPYCEVKTCLRCAKKCTLQWASRPKCASCNKAFTAEVIDGMFKKSFRRGPLRQAAIQNLVEQEISLLPHTMEVLHQRKLQEKYDAASYELDLNLSLLRRLLIDNNPEAEECITQARALASTMRDTGLNATKRTKREIKHRTTKCPGKDCRGYIIGNSSCAICNMRVCRDCNAGLAPDTIHACSEDDIASWTLIKSSTKPCPSCGVGIEKILGCNQMWCTMPECNTAFDWSSGLKINGPIHNPHYHDWLREGGQEAVGNLQANYMCEIPGQVFNHRRTQDIYNCIGQGFGGKAHEPLYNAAFQFIRALPELADRRFLRPAPAYSPEMYESLRIEYLENRITKEQWSTNLSCRETKRTKQERINALMAMFEAAASDLFVRLHSDLEALKGPQQKVHVSSKEALPFVKAFVRGCESLRIYFCTEMGRVISDYSNKSIRALTWQPADRGLVLIWHHTDVRQLDTQYQSWIDPLIS